MIAILFTQISGTMEHLGIRLAKGKIVVSKTD